MLKGSKQLATRQQGGFHGVPDCDRVARQRGRQTRAAGGRAGPGPPTRAKIGRDEKMCNAGRLSSQVYRASLSDDLSK